MLNSLLVNDRFPSVLGGVKVNIRCQIPAGKEERPGGRGQGDTGLRSCPFRFILFGTVVSDISPGDPGDLRFLEALPFAINEVS